MRCCGGSIDFDESVDPDVKRWSNVPTGIEKASSMRWTNVYESSATASWYLLSIVQLQTSRYPLISRNNILSYLVKISLKSGKTFSSGH